MNITLSPKTKKMIDARLKSGKYKTTQDVIEAAVSTLEIQEKFGDFAPGEIDALLADGEKDIARGDVIVADAVFAELRRLSASRRAAAR